MQHEQTTTTTTSADGTTIAYESFGEGTSLVLVGGAFNDRQSPVAGIPLARALADAGAGAVYAYDRRGRGDSGDSPPYDPAREVEDLAAVIDAAGGAAGLFGHSSGAALALRAAAAGIGVTRVAAFEPPFTDAARSPDGGDPTLRHPGQDLAEQIDELVRAGERGAAVELFQISIGIPAEVVEQTRHAPFRPALDAIAHTLVYDLQVLGSGAVPVDELRAVDVPTLVMVGAASPEPLRVAARAVADAVPGASLTVLEGLDHSAGTDDLAPVLGRFFAA